MTKLALITGASGGIGQSISEKLAQNGYDLLLHYHTNEKAALHLQKGCHIHTAFTLKSFTATCPTPEVQKPFPLPSADGR